MAHIIPGKRAYCKKPPPFIRCIVATAVLLLMLLLTIFFFLPRQPTIAVTGIAVDLGEGTVDSRNPFAGATARLNVGLTITNNCWYDLAFQSLVFKATNENYDRGNAPFARGSHNTSFVVPSRQAISVMYPFSVAYEGSKDDGFQFAKQVGLFCASSVLRQDAALKVKMTVDVQFEALGVLYQLQHVAVQESMTSHTNNPLHMADEEDFSKLPLEQQLEHKSWKARVAGYEQLGRLFARTDDEKIAEHRNLADHLKKAASDANAVAHEAALDAVLQFATHSPVSLVPKFRPTLLPLVIEKGMASTRAGSRAKSVDITLMFVEVENKADSLLDDVIPALAHKNPKNVAAAVSVLKEMLRLFGSKVVPVKPLVKQLAKLFDHKDSNVRNEATALATELYRWLGPAILPSLSDLKPVQLKELNEHFEQIGTVRAVPERLVRSEMEKRAKVGYVAEDVTAGVIVAAEPEPVDAFDISDPVNVLDHLPPKFYETLGATKWSERKEILEALLALLKVPKLEDGRYGELINVLSKRVNDAHVLVLSLAINCIEFLARGLRSNFSQYRGIVITPLLEKLKEKKAAVLESLRSCLDAVFLSVSSITDVLEDISTFLKHKNPQVKQETTAWLLRCLRAIRKMPAKPDIKALIELLGKLLDDADVGVREAGAEGLGTLMKIVGEKPLMPVFDKVDKAREAKIREFCEKAEVKIGMSGGKRIVASAPVVEPPVSESAKSASPVLGRPKSAAPAGKPVLGAKKPASAKPAASSAGSSATATSSGASKKKTSSADEPITFKFSDDSAELWMSENFPTLDLKEFSDSNWKVRLAACHAFLETLKSGSGPADAEAIVRFFSKSPGWKESNFQVMTAIMAIFDHLAKECNASKASLSIVIPALAEKLGDAKLKKVTGDVFGTFAERASLQFVLFHLYDPLNKAKSPKVVADGLIWIHQSIMDFGIAGGLDIRALVDFVKGTLSNTNAAVRGNAVIVLGGLRMYVGPEVRTFLGDLSGQLLAVIDAEFEKVAGRAAPAPTRVIAVDPAAGGSSADPMDSLFPRVDLMTRVTPELLEKMGHAQWGQRKEALEELAAIIESTNKRLKPNIGEVPSALKARLNDSNRNLGILAVEVCGNLAAAVGKPFSKHAGNLIGPMAVLLGDQKVHVRTAAINALENVHGACGVDVFIGPSATVLVADQPNLRKDLLKFLGDKLEAQKAAGSIPKMEELLKPILMCLQDKNSDVRKNASVVLAFVAEDVGITYVQDRAGDWYNGSALASIKPYFAPLQDLVKGGGPSSPKASSGSKKAGGASDNGGAASTGLPRGLKSQPSTAAGLKKRPTTMPPPSKSAAAASPTPTSSESIPVLTSDLRMKEQRAGQDRGMTKWTFEAPRKDLVDFLSEQCSANFSDGIVALLFSTDHYKEKDFLQGLSLLDDSVVAANRSGDPDLKARFVANCDLVLKYLTIRFFDTNTSMLIKGLELVEHLFTLLEEEGVVLSEYEAGSFFPFFITKVGDNKETMRLKVRSIFKQVPKIYPPSKFFSHLLNALTSKNSRTRTECLEELGDLIKKNGMSVCVPSKALPIIAAQISDSDAKVRNAALGTVTNAYMLLGDAVYKLLGRINDKDKSLLEEKVKRLPPPSVPAVSAAASVAPKPSSPLFQKRKLAAPNSSEDVSSAAAGLVGIPKQNGSAGGIRKEFSLDQDVLNSVSSRPSKPQLSFQPQSEANSRSSSELNMGDSLMIDFLVTRVTAADATQSIDALKRLEKLIVGQPDQIISYIDQIVNAITLQVRLAFSASDLTTPMASKLCKVPLNVLVVVFSSPAISKAISRPSLYQCVQEMLNRLLDPALQSLENGPIMSKALNVMMVRVLENCDRNMSFSVLLSLLEQSANATLHCLPDDVPLQAKYTELVMKCLWKLTKLIPQLVNEGVLDPTQLIAGVHNFLKVSPPNEWKRRAAEKVIPQADMPLRTVKTILHELCNCLGDRVLQCLSGVDDISKSHAVGYIRQMLGNAAILSGNPIPEPVPEPPVVVVKRVENPVVDYDGTLQAMRRSMTVPARDAAASRIPSSSPTSQLDSIPNRAPSPPKAISRNSQYNLQRRASDGPLSEVEADAQLTVIFARISAKEETKQGIADLYAFRKRHPDCEVYVSAHLGRTGNYFQGYIKRGLAALEDEEKSGGGVSQSNRTAGVAGISTPVSASAVALDAHDQAADPYRETLNKFQQRLHAQTDTTGSSEISKSTQRYSMPIQQDTDGMNALNSSSFSSTATGISMARSSMQPLARPTNDRFQENKPPSQSAATRTQTVEQLKQRLAAMKMQQMNNNNNNNAESG
ncbi:Microtubule-associated protein, microtubule dynamics during spindle orientation [Chytriomyces hyalinus]|nr:Microtubule-associated protein, microtubule dynamics during spindle orientation [Chytriomyces hyalinus]